MILSATCFRFSEGEGFCPQLLISAWCYPPEIESYSISLESSFSLRSTMQSVSRASERGSHRVEFSCSSRSVESEPSLFLETVQRDVSSFQSPPVVCGTVYDDSEFCMPTEAFGRHSARRGSWRKIGARSPGIQIDVRELEGRRRCRGENSRF